MQTFRLDLVQFIIYFGILNTTILSTLLFFSKKNRTADKWLALLLLGITADQLSHSLFSRLFTTFPNFTLEHLSIIYALGPLVWLYVAQLTVVNFSFQKKHLLVFVPFFVDLIYMLCKALYVRVFAVADKASFYDTQFPLVQLEFLIHDGLAILYNTAFFVLSYLLLAKYRRSLKQNFSSTRNVSLFWLQSILVALTLILLAWASYHIVEISTYPTPLPPEKYYPFWVALILVTLTLGYRSLLQSHIHLHEIEVPSSSSKYQSSRLETNELQALANKLKSTIESEKLYLNPTLRLADLCTPLNLTTHTVSQVISQGLDTTFYDLINGYRVEEVKRLLLQPEHQHLNLIALAYEAGFNSKTAYYDAFKKYTGKSPSQYKKDLIHS